MSLIGSRNDGVLVPFPPPESRPLRASARAEAAGAILLFTGVRYDRPAADGPQPGSAAGEKKSRPRSKRSR